MGVIQRKFEYCSSADGGGPLYAVAAYDDERAHMPLLVLRGAYMGGDSLLPELEEFARAGLFALWPLMRGHGECAGKRDSGGIEIMDIYDAVAAAIAGFGQLIDPGNLNIFGRSGGGGNVYSCLVRFPDLWRCAVAMYGVSDYGYDRQLGWYFHGAAAKHRAQLEADIGVPGEAVDQYMARASLLAAGNNGQTSVHLFCDAEEETCGLPMHTEFLARTRARDYRNVQMHVSGPGDRVRWTHDRSGYKLADVASHFVPAVLAGALPQPQLPSAGSLVVLGFLQAQPFSIWLGDGQNAVADLNYELLPERKRFVFHLRTADSSIAGRLTIPGPEPRLVLENGKPSYWDYSRGATVIEINPNRAYDWFPCADEGD